MYRKFVYTLTLLACLAAAGCRQDAEIESLVAELHAFSEELVQKVQSAPSPSAGVDEGQRLMDARKAELRAKVAALKGVRGFQVSAETKRKMTETLTRDALKVAGLQMRYVGVSVRDPAFKAKLDRLVRDYTEIFKLA
jgi:Tfp pilus assembly protein PilP